MAIPNSPRLCSLETAIGKQRICPEYACPFWEKGVAGGHCALDRLDVAADVPLAGWLLEIRQQLTAAGAANDDRVMRSAFHHVLNDSPE
jgi:hypothetical protein